VRGLRFRKHEVALMNLKDSKESNPDTLPQNAEDKSDESSHEYLLESLRLWKVETLDIVLTPSIHCDTSTSLEVDVFNNDTGEESHQAKLSPRPPASPSLSRRSGSSTEDLAQTSQHPLSASSKLRRSQSQSKRPPEDPSSSAEKKPKPPVPSPPLASPPQSASLLATKPSSPRRSTSSSVAISAHNPKPVTRHDSPEDVGPGIPIEEIALGAISRRAPFRSLSDSVSSSSSKNEERKSRESNRNVISEETEDRKERRPDPLLRKSRAGAPVKGGHSLSSHASKVTLGRDYVEVETSTGGS